MNAAKFASVTSVLLLSLHGGMAAGQKQAEAAPRALDSITMVSPHRAKLTAASLTFDSETAVPIVVRLRVNEQADRLVAMSVHVGRTIVTIPAGLLSCIVNPDPASVGVLLGAINARSGRAPQIVRIIVSFASWPETGADDLRGHAAESSDVAIEIEDDVVTAAWTIDPKGMRTEHDVGVVCRP